MDLNTRIEFVTEENIVDDEGFCTPALVSEYTCWANRKVLSGTKEFLVNSTTNSKIICSFGVRCCNFIKGVDSLSYKIKHKGNIYNIVQVDDSYKDYIYFKGECING